MRGAGESGRRTHMKMDAKSAIVCNNTKKSVLLYGHGKCMSFLLEKYHLPYNGGYALEGVIFPVSGRNLNLTIDLRQPYLQ